MIPGNRLTGSPYPILTMPINLEVRLCLTVRQSLTSTNLSIFLAGLRPRPLGRKEYPVTSEATLLYRARIGEGMQTPSQSLASSRRDVSLLLDKGANKTV